MNKIFVTSDTHFCHNREFLYGPRGFSTVADMNKAIVSNWNKIVDMEDTVYLLGDVMLNDNDLGTRLLKNLKGKIHIILGNHDTAQRIEIYNKCYNVKNVSYAEKLDYNGYHFFLSHYPTLTSNFDYNKPLKSRVISLCGHTHTNDKFADWGEAPIYHCELDAHNCIPVCIDQIISDIISKH